MQCYIHPDRVAVVACARCGRAICQACVDQAQGQPICRECLSKPTLLTPGGQGAVTDPLATTSLVLAILGLLGCACGGPLGGIFLGIPAFITGWMARRNAARSGAAGRTAELALVGLVLGALETLASVALLILVVVGVGIAILGGYWQ